MALTTLAGLKAAVLAWAERTDDAAATSIIDDCVTLCEARINSFPGLRVQAMETTATLTLTSGSSSLPTDFLALKRVGANYSSPRLLHYAEPGWYQEAYPDTGTDEGCDFYTIVGATIKSKSSATLDIVYYAKVPSLTVTDPNWLLTKAPNVYLFGTLTELERGLGGDAQNWDGLFTQGLSALISDETFQRGGAMAVRASGPSP